MDDIKDLFKDLTPEGVCVYMFLFFVAEAVVASVIQWVIEWVNGRR